MHPHSQFLLFFLCTFRLEFSSLHFYFPPLFRSWSRRRETITRRTFCLIKTSYFYFFVPKTRSLVYFSKSSHVHTQWGQNRPKRLIPRLIYISSYPVPKKFLTISYIYIYTRVSGVYIRNTTLTFGKIFLSEQRFSKLRIIFFFLHNHNWIFPFSNMIGYFFTNCIREKQNEEYFPRKWNVIEQYLRKMSNF